MDPILEIESLTTEFKTEDSLVKAVNSVSFTVHKGETVGIVGESGSGKSVTSLSVMRLISSPGKISSGRIFYHPPGKEKTDLLSLQDEDMRKLRGNEIAMIFQEPMTSLNPVLTCGSQVAEALIIHKNLDKKQARQKTQELFARVQLPDPSRQYDSYPHQLSGGQKQRVMIAMAMCCDPQLLIADEPTTALDVTVQARILELMRQLQQENGMGLMFITHDLGVVAEIADRVVVMYKGKIVEQGEVREIFYHPRHPYTKGLLACRPPLNKRLSTLPVVSDFMKEEPGGAFSELPGSIESVVDSRVQSGDERKQQHQVMYAKSPVLRVRNLKTWFPVRKGLFGKTRGFVKAVDDISFEVFPCETLGLVGESGCGKTTLGRTILRLIEPTGGEVMFQGMDFLQLRGNALRKMRKRIQIIFQDPYSSLNPRMTIGNAIREPMTVHGLHKNEKGRKEKVMELLDLVGLTAGHYNRFPHEFSGGQRQRVCIARALALQPEFIICDESVSALDVSVQAQVLNLLNTLKKEFGFTYIFISHDLSVVKFMSDRMIVMNKGKIEEMGDPDVIYATPRSEYTRRLISAIPASDPEAAFSRKKTN
ncbi:MAG: ABC transporter ATP-binding protein [Bacteroidia bacterium]|nr:ABC transporter ATP-binding protein [Bacteroidia bacterium]